MEIIHQIARIIIRSRKRVRFVNTAATLMEYMILDAHIMTIIRIGWFVRSVEV